jgi:hypothetical protein
MKEIELRALLLSIMILITGCSSDITDKDINTAAKICENNDGISHVWKHLDFTYAKVKCKNGGEFTVHVDVDDKQN